MLSSPWTLLALLFAILACVVALVLLDELEPVCVKYAEAPKGVMLQLPYKPVCTEWK